MKKKRKKNPVDNVYISLLTNAIKLGNLGDLTGAISYYKQGIRCNDCNEKYYACFCEKCDECGFTRCLCDLGSDLGRYSRDKIKKVAWELAQLTLTEEQFQEIFIRCGMPSVRYITEKLKDLETPKIDQKWLASK